MTTIRTPDDERPDWLYPPFRESWLYQAATYPGHSNFAVDLNRRTKTGAWVDDTGDPVLAAQDGTVAEVDPREGLVYLNHWGGKGRTEYRHMTGPFPKVGQKVKRGDRIGSIGNVAGDGRSFGSHLHMVFWERDDTSKPFRRGRLRFYGKPLEVSVADSDTKPSAWKPPAPVMVEGPPPKATWESAFREAKRALEKAEKQASDATTAKGAAEAALAEEKAAHLLTGKALKAEIADVIRDLDIATARIAELEARPPADCAEETDRALTAERKLDDIRAVLAR